MSKRRNNASKKHAYRRSRGRPTKRTMLIVCEGQATERIYFDGLKREAAIAERYAVTVKRGRGGSRKQIAANAVAQRDAAGEKFDETCCVLDVETAEDRASLDAALSLLQTNGIESYLSNPAFEVWLLAHFERTASRFLDGDSVARSLDKHWRKSFDVKYEKADPNVYSRVKDKTEIALANAKSVREKHHGRAKSTADCNSSTDVYNLVEGLLHSKM